MHLPPFLCHSRKYMDICLPNNIYMHFQYSINTGVTHVTSSCSWSCDNKYRLKVFEVPVNFDSAIKECRALFAYVQSAAFFSLCGASLTPSTPSDPLV